MSEWIEKLDRWLRQNRSEYYAQLRPGLTSEEIRELEAQLGLTLPTGLATLLQWRNGQSEGCYSSFFYNYQLMGAPEILSAREILNELIEDGEQSEAWWSPTWVRTSTTAAGTTSASKRRPARMPARVSGSGTS